MLDLIKRLRNKLNPKPQPEVKDEPVHAHLCEGKEWKPFPSNLCSVCRGSSMNFMFFNQERYDNAVELKDKQQDRKAS